MAPGQQRPRLTGLAHGLVSARNPRRDKAGSVSLWAARTLGPGTVAAGPTRRTTTRPTWRATGAATARPAAATASFRASRRTAPWRTTGAGATSSGPSGATTLSPHLLGKLRQFIPIELAVAVGVERQGALDEPLRARRSHPGAPATARTTLRWSSGWRSSRATFALAGASWSTFSSPLSPRPPLTRRAAAGPAFSTFASSITSSFTIAGPKTTRRAFARRPMLPGGMRGAKLLLVDDAVAVAIQGEKSGGGILDFFGIEAVIPIAIEGLTERIKRRRTGGRPPLRTAWRLGEGQRAEADDRDRCGDPAPGSCSKFHRMHPAF